MSGCVETLSSSRASQFVLNIEFDKDVELSPHNNTPLYCEADLMRTFELPLPAQISNNLELVYHKHKSRPQKPDHLANTALFTISYISAEQCCMFTRVREVT